MDERARAIAKRAYEIWEAEGRQHGLDEVYWLRAEQELGFTADRSMQGSKPGAPGADDPHRETPRSGETPTPENTPDAADLLKNTGIGQE